MPALLEVRNLNVEFPLRNEPGSPRNPSSLGSGTDATAVLSALDSATVVTGPATGFLAVRDLAFSISEGKVLGLVGESGSGKSITSLAVMRLLPPQARVSGEIWFGDGEASPRNLLEIPEAEMRRLRGSSIAMIFQEPMTALNPAMRVGDQIAEAVLAHQAVSKSDAWRRAVEGMRDVAINDPERRARDYPHQLSGGPRSPRSRLYRLPIPPEPK